MGPPIAKIIGPGARRAIELINESLVFLKGTGVDVSPLTADNQGFVRAMTSYYAGPVTNNWSEGLWTVSRAAIYS
jgi:hypothetical protein